MLDNLERLNWQILFETLLGKQNVKFKIEATDTELSIKTEEQYIDVIKKTLESVLQTPSSFQENLPYQITSSINSTVKQNTQIRSYSEVEPPKDTIETGKSILLNLFGEDAFTESGFSVELLFNEKQSHIEEGVLFSMPGKSQAQKVIWNDLMNNLMLYFNGVDINTLRDIWKTQGILLPKPPENLDKQEESNNVGITDSLIQQCFGVLTRENPKQVEMFFNYRRLYEFLFPPKIIKNTNTELKINLNHFISYLQQLIQGDVLFRTFQQSGSERYSARPIFIGQESTIPQSHFYTIIIDRSSSMQNYFFDLKKHVNAFIDKLYEIDQTAKVRIVFFDDDIVAKEFAIKNLNEVKSYVSAQQIGWMTRIFGTIADELDYIRTNKLISQNNCSLIFFSDGGDTVEKNENNKMPLVYSKIQAFDDQRVEKPKMFTLSFGDADTKTLGEVANVMGNHCIHLKDVNDFQRICSQISKMKYKRELIDFLYEVEGLKHQFTIPFYQMNSPQTLDVTIPMGKAPTKLEFRGKEVWVSMLDETKIPEASLSDQLVEYVSEARRVVVNEQLSIEEKITQLTETLNSIDRLQFSDLEQSQVEEAKNDINNYLKQLNEAIHDTRMQESLISLVRSQQGFMNSSNSISITNNNQSTSQQIPQKSLTNS